MLSKEATSITVEATSGALSSRLFERCLYIIVFNSDCGRNLFVLYTVIIFFNQTMNYCFVFRDRIIQSIKYVSLKIQFKLSIYFLFS